MPRLTPAAGCAPTGDASISNGSPSTTDRRMIRSPPTDNVACSWLPVRPDLTRHALKCIFDQLRHEQASRIDGPRHLDAALRNLLEACARIVTFVADQHDQTVSRRFRLRHGAL